MNIIERAERTTIKPVHSISSLGDNEHHTIERMLNASPLKIARFYFDAASLLDNRINKLLPRTAITLYDRDIVVEFLICLAAVPSPHICCIHPMNKTLQFLIIRKIPAMPGKINH